MSEQNMKSTVESLFQGMDGLISSKTVVGEAIHIGNTILLPLVDVSFGVGAGAFSKEKSSNNAGGLGGRISPSAVLVINDGNIRLVNIKNQDSITKILDMVPDFVDKFMDKKKGGAQAPKEAVDAMDEMLKDSVNKTEE